MLPEQRLDVLSNLLECNNDSLLMESVSYAIEDSNELFNEIFFEYGCDEFVCESGKIKNFLSKSKGAIAKVMTACKKLAEYLGSKIIQKIENGLKNPKLAKVKIKIPGKNPIDVQKNLNSGWKQIQKVLNDFKKQSAYNKAIIPTANAISWIVFPAVPGVTETILAASSIGEFLLDYKRIFLGQQYSAIKNFSDYIQSSMDKLDESTIYESDKILQKVSNFIDSLNGEIKRLTLALDSQAFKGIEKGSDMVNSAADKLNNEKVKDKVKDISKKSKDAAKTAKDGAKEDLDKFKELREKRKSIKARNKANKELKGDKSPAVSPVYTQGKVAASSF